MKTNRREFLKLSGIAGAGLMIPWKLSLPGRPAGLPSNAIPQTPVVGTAIPKYVHPLPHFANNRVTGTDIKVTMEEFQQKVLPDSFYSALSEPYEDGTYVWGYEVGEQDHLYPGFTVEARKGIPTTMTFENDLPSNGGLVQQYITVDQTLHWADPLGTGMSMTRYAGPPPAVAHLHGGEVPSDFDGGPDAWFTPTGIKGNGYRTLTITDGNKAVYRYPNDQEAATLWFHDHALGATRLNVYAGLAAFYLLRDERDTGLSSNPIGLPAGNYEIELAIQDRMFDANGQLYFPDTGINPEHPFWIPEFFGDVIVVNGRSWPYLEVEPRRYRFRMLDGCNARFLEMFLDNKVTKAPGPAFWVIGSDGGLLDAPVKLNDPAAVKPTRLIMGPGERYDVIIDFSGYAGQILTLRNQGKSPSPRGKPADPATTGQIMEFRVTLPLAGTDTSYNPAAPATNLRSSPIAILSSPTVKRQLTLNEVMGGGGPLEALVNNTGWDEAHTELPANGSTEEWTIINLTGDVHPIHLHLVQFRIKNRQGFNVSKYMPVYNAAFPGGAFLPASGPPNTYSEPNAGGYIGGNPDVTRYLQGPARPPAPEERGWKDTVLMYPGQVTRILVRFKRQDGGSYSFDPTGTTPYSYDKNGNFTGGPGYVWHCHIVDHEDNEMMRPYHPV